MNFIKIFEECVETFSNNIALKFENKEVSYWQLNEKVNQFANYLKSKGFSAGDRVGIHLSRSLETVISILAVIKVGAVYIPLDPEYPMERIKFIIEDAQIKAMISNDSKRLNENNLNVINVEDVLNQLKDFSDQNLDTDLNSHDLAYIIYTSGSSGKPKGVAITHSNLFNFIKNSSANLDILKTDIYLLSASTNYALSVRQIFVPLSFGAKLVIVNTMHMQDPAEFVRLLKNESITLIDFVPSHFRAVLFYLKSLNEKKRLYLLSNKLRRIVTIGEPLTADLVKIWYDEFNQDCLIINIFGQTETTGVISSFIVEKGKKYNGIISIGKPIANTEIFILDEEMKLVNNGRVGELYVSNLSVSSGYLNREDLTRQKFLTNFFNSQSCILYKTGDLVKMGIDNNIYYVGRKDSQLKVRGMRVDTNEIEAVINELPFIADSAVVPIDPNSFSTKLVGFLIYSDTENHNQIDLVKDWLRLKLPAHMIPSFFIKLVELPKTPNGKVDRLKLSEYKLPGQLEEREEKLTLTESKLIKIWEKLIKRKNIRVNENFFDIGGDSLSAVLLFIEIEKEFKRHIPISALYNFPTIKSLAKNIESISDSLFKSLVAVKVNDSSGLNLFFIHGAGGNILIYKDLVKYINPQFNFYGLQSRGLLGENEMQFKIEDMADSYLAEIKKIQPGGPYFLGGYCLGGTIALEIAQQLYNLGEEVKAVILLETYNWSALPKRNKLDKMNYSFQKILFHFENLFLLRGKDKMLFLDNKWKELLNRKNIWLGSFKNFLFEHSNSKNNFNRILAEVWEKNDIAAFNYKAENYAFDIIHVVPLKRYAIHNYRSADWEAIGTKLQSITLPVYPAGMLVEPFVQKLASELNDILAEKIS